MNVLTDIEYAQTDERPLLLDLYLPDEGEHRDDQPPPLLVWIHGGGWRKGSKENPPLLPLVEEGFALASIQYRLSGEATFPAQIHDCKGAVRWLRAHAERYGYGTERIGVAGSSAGGHLAALLGTSNGVKALEGTVGGPAEQSSEVHAVVDFYGPTDMRAMLDYPSDIDHAAADSPEAQLLGGPVAEKPRIVRAANPITYISQHAPPFLIMHGSADRIVPFNQSVLLNEALLANGVDATLIVVKDAGHGGPKFFDNSKRYVQVLNFLEQHLRFAPVDEERSFSLPL